MVEAIVGRLASILIHMLISQDVRNECKQRDDGVHGRHHCMMRLMRNQSHYTLD